MKTSFKCFLFIIITSLVGCGRSEVPSSRSEGVALTELSAHPSLRVLNVQQYENRMVGDVDASPWVTLVELEAYSCDQLYDGDFNIEIDREKLRLIPARDFNECLTEPTWQKVIASTSELGSKTVIEIEGHKSHRVERIEPQY